MRCFTYVVEDEKTGVYSYGVPRGEEVHAGDAANRDRVVVVGVKRCTAVSGRHETQRDPKVHDEQRFACRNKPSLVDGALCETPCQEVIVPENGAHLCYPQSPLRNVRDPPAVTYHIGDCRRRPVITDFNPRRERNIDKSSSDSRDVAETVLRKCQRDIGDLDDPLL